jgi:hypothetical protein
VTACDYCGGDAIEGSTCPRAIPCSTCHASAGSPCYRPSGHRAMTLHAERIAAAEELDAAAGIPYELVDEPLTLELEELVGMSSFETSPTERPCIVCYMPTTDRHVTEERPASGVRRRAEPRCGDVAACAQRRAARRAR